MQTYTSDNSSFHVNGVGFVSLLIEVCQNAVFIVFILGCLKILNQQVVR